MRCATIAMPIMHHDIMFKKYVDNLNMILKDNPIYQDWVA